MVHKLHKLWANSVQVNCDRRQSSWPSSSLSLEEVVVYLHCRVLWPSIFLIFIVWMNWRTLQPTDSLLKAATNYDELPYSVSPNPQEAIVALPSFQLLCHRCFDHPRRWKWYWETSLLRESCFKECGDLLPKAERTCLAIIYEVPRNQSFASIANLFWEDILVVITIVTIWFEGENAQGSKESVYSRFISAIPKGRGVPAGWQSPRGSSCSKSNWRIVGDDVWRFFHSPLGRRRNSPLSWKGGNHGSLI